jgi:hypothetical protein
MSMMPAIDAVASRARAISVRRSWSFIHTYNTRERRKMLRSASTAFLDEGAAQRLVE